MKNVTITLEEDVAKWARVWAAKHDTSVSRLLGELLKEKMEAEGNYTQAMKSFLAKEPVQLRESPEESYPSRDSVYER